MARLTAQMGRAHAVIDFGETAPVDPRRVAEALAADPAITHVGVIHCETSTGILNPLAEVAAVVAAAGRRLVIDAMSSFGALPILAGELAFDAVIASSNKCLEGVPGMGFVLVRETALAAAEGNSPSLSLDLLDQWRYTPPTHVVAALAAALRQYDEQGGRPARLARYQANCAALLGGLERLGLKPFLAPELQAPVIVTVHAPAGTAWDFQRFYAAVKARGVVLYPGKLTSVETFRVGCIGAIGAAEMGQAIDAIAHALNELGLQP
jgi:2-aminoethylphosphonate-pyruvate transaminase